MLWPGLIGLSASGDGLLGLYKYFAAGRAGLYRLLKMYVFGSGFIHLYGRENITPAIIYITVKLRGDTFSG